jgi:hypothetical protein
VSRAEDELTETLLAMMEAIRLQERLRAFLPLLNVMVDELKHVAQIDAELQPEVVAAMEAVGAAADAIGRAALFVDARLEVRIGYTSEG